MLAPVNKNFFFVVAKGAFYNGLWIPQTLGNVGILGQSAQDYVLEINTLLPIALKENLL